MQSHVINVLLNAYLIENAHAIDLTRFTLPNIGPSQNPLLVLENVYQTIQQSLITKNHRRLESNVDQEQEQESENEKPIKDNTQITITVCDEAKKTKKQFHCNRTLLIREMRYFADYLKDESEQLEEVDISVHCDLDIFQWLMSFVNRHQTQQPPVLEPRFVVSILISSEFLKMDKLVALSLDFIHDHINEIVSNNTTLSSIPDNVFRQLAQRFDDPYDIEQIPDRRNKIRSKLFEANLEFLLTKTKFIRCQHCLTVMTVEQMGLLSCQNDRLVLRTNGKLDFQHKIDPKFDINQWAKEIYNQCDNVARKACWTIWLHINGDYCARCQNYFRFIDFSRCSYHPSSMLDKEKYECCSHPIHSFDVLRTNNRDDGCQQRDHLCQNQTHSTQIFQKLDKTEFVKSTSNLLSSILAEKRTAELVNKAMEQSIFGSASVDGRKGTLKFQWTPQMETGSAAAQMKFSWDSTKSTRWNQDAQREDEHRRFENIVRSMNIAQQANKSAAHRSLKESTSVSLVPSIGIYYRIENEWRNRQNTPLNTIKNRPRITLK